MIILPVSEPYRVTDFTVVLRILRAVRALASHVSVGPALVCRPLFLIGKSVRLLKGLSWHRNMQRSHDLVFRIPLVDFQTLP